MEVGAVITAAGKSSRMGAYKPLLQVGGYSAAKRVIQNIRSAGIGSIVVVTGNRADELESSLQGLEVTFLRNDLYEYNEMFDSVRIGLRRLKDKCEKVLVTPVDVPLFSPGTVTALMKSSADIAIPGFNGQTGHPVVINGRVIQDIIEYDGEDGLTGAISRLSFEAEIIEVNDRGILFDMDTPADYAEIIKMYGHLSDGSDPDYLRSGN